MVTTACRLPALLLALLVLAACAAPKKQPVDQLASTQEAVAVQSALLARGFSPGPVDGVIGEQTRQAIAAYQRTYDLPVSGYVDAPLKASLFGRTGALSLVDNTGVDNLRYLEPPYPADLRAFLEGRYGRQAANARPYGSSIWLDVSTASLGSGEAGAAVIVNAWSPDERQTSELSIFQKSGGGYREVLGPLPNQGFEFAESVSNGLHDVAVSQGQGLYRLWRFDGSRYR